MADKSPQQVSGPGMLDSLFSDILGSMGAQPQQTQQPGAQFMQAPNLSQSGGAGNADFLKLIMQLMA